MVTEKEKLIARCNTRDFKRKIWLTTGVLKTPKSWGILSFNIDDCYKEDGKIKLQIEGYKCERCTHEWIPRKKEYPVTCPKCKSPYWDRPRINKKKEDDENI